MTKKKKRGIVIKNPYGKNNGFLKKAMAGIHRQTKKAMENALQQAMKEFFSNKGVEQSGAGFNGMSLIKVKGEPEHHLQYQFDSLQYQFDSQHRQFVFRKQTRSEGDTDLYDIWLNVDGRVVSLSIVLLGAGRKKKK